MNKGKRSALALYVLLIAGGALGGCSKAGSDSASAPPVVGSQAPPQALASQQQSEAMNKAKVEAQGRAMMQNQKSAPK